MRFLGFLLIAGVLLAAGKLAAPLMSLALLTAHPGWFALLTGLVVFHRWLEKDNPPIQEAKLRPPPKDDQPHC